MYKFFYVNLMHMVCKVFGNGTKQSESDEEPHESNFTFSCFSSKHLLPSICYVPHIKILKLQTYIKLRMQKILRKR